MYKHVTKCRACGNPKLIPVCDLGVQPLANDFTFPGEECAGHAPLKVLFCEECTLGQLSVVVDPKIIYSNYPYVTSKSQTMLGHFELLWKAINQECDAKSVVEIGSNDGGFLNFCLDHGAALAVGIDPAANLIPGFRPGLASICDLFGADSAVKAASLIPNPGVVVARHVFAHIDDWQAFMKDLDIVTSKNTLVVIEVPYVTDMLEGVEFDTIYHEHLSYVSIWSVQALLKKTNFHLHKVLRFHIHGGAIVMMLRRNDSDFQPDISVEKFLVSESVDHSSWTRFSMETERKIDALKDSIIVRLRYEGAKFCGFGASAKSTVWINAAGLRDQIEFICDCTPSKQGKLSPGTRIPVVSEVELMARKPDYAIMFAWNFKAEILRNNQAYLDAGGHFIIPDHKIEIV